MLKITYSQNLQQLANALIEECFFETPCVFEKRLIVVPHSAMHDFLVKHCVEHPRLQMLAGVTILPLHQAAIEIGECSLIEDHEILPSFLELSLGIEEVLSQEEWVPHVTGSSKKLGAFAREVAEVFMQYGLYGFPALTGWQKLLWERLFPPFSSPFSFLKARSKLPFKGKVYLFGFSELPPVYLHFFSSFDSSCYFFSPCALFWDEDSPSLLSHWGVLGKKFLNSLDPFSVIEQELYVDPPSSSLLHQLQRTILKGEREEFKQDGSIEIYSAPSKMKEVERLQTRLYELSAQEGVQPSDVLVLVADMPAYLPFIEALFHNSPWPIKIEDARIRPEEEALLKLLYLQERRFALKEVMEILSSSSFQKKWQISQEEVERLQELFSSAGIIEDLQGHEHSWQEGISRLLYGLVLSSYDDVPLNPFPLPLVGHTEIDLFNRFLKWFKLLRKEEGHKSTTEWISFLIEQAELHFGWTEEESSCVVELKKLLSRCFFCNQALFPLEKAIRILEQLLHKTRSSSPWDRTLFMSTDTLHIPPAAVIICLGMDEESFPKVKSASSLLQISLPYSTKEEQRYVLLEAIMKAKSRLILSYERVDPLDGKEKKGSFLVEELQRFLKADLCIPYYPPSVVVSEKHVPFLEEISLEAPSVVSITDLKKCARNSVQLYFNQALGVFFSSQDDEEEKSFLLSSLDKALFRKEAGVKLICRKEREGKLPQGAFAKVAIRELHHEVKEKQQALFSFGLTQEEVEQIALIQNLRQEGKKEKRALSLSYCAIEGVLEGVTSKGLLIDAEFNERAAVKAWPLYLLYCQLYPESPYLLFTKDHTRQQISLPPAILERYVEFYRQARGSCCPFHADYAKFFFKNDYKGFQAAVEKEEQDPYFLYLKRKGALDEVLSLFHAWQPRIVSVFEPLIEVFA